MYNDIDVGSTLFLEGSKDRIDVEEWVDYITVMEKDLLFEPFFSFIYLTNAFENYTQRLDKALSRSQKASLVITNTLEVFRGPQNFLINVSEDIFHNNIWLFLYPFFQTTQTIILLT